MSVADGQGMDAKSHIEMRAVPLLTNAGFSLADTGHWKKVVLLIAAAFAAIMFIAQWRDGGKLEKGVEVALSEAWHLLHQADQENRNIRPLPLSMAVSEPGERVA
jgi:hypothetical protein